MPRTAAIFDLDRTLISGSSSVTVQNHLAEAGLTGAAKVPFAGAFNSYYELFGENWLMMQPARFAAKASAGWSVETVATACAAAAHDIAEQVHPFARQVIDEHRANGVQLVLATTSPEAFVRPIADALEFDDVICTKWVSEDGAYTGELDGPFVWGREKAKAVKRWAKDNGVSLKRSFAYSDSYFDAPMLDLVGNPTAVNPDPKLAAAAVANGWPIRHFDKSDGVLKIAGREIQEWGRPFLRPELVAPNVDFTFSGVENIPADGPVLIVFNHRSYFDPTVMGLIGARAGRNMRGLGKKEVFDAPVIGPLMKAVGGIRVERASGSDEPLEKAAEALRGGEVRDDGAPGHHSPRASVLRSRTQGSVGRGQARSDDRGAGRAGRALGHRTCVAPQRPAAQPVDVVPPQGVRRSR